MMLQNPNRNIFVASMINNKVVCTRIPDDLHVHVHARLGYLNVVKNSFCKKRVQLIELCGLLQRLVYSCCCSVLFYLIGACSKFVALSLRDVERFKRQKVKDLKDVFTSYAIMQIERCKKVGESTMTAAEASGSGVLLCGVCSHSAYNVSCTCSMKSS